MSTLRSCTSPLLAALALLMGLMAFSLRLRACR